MDANDFDAKPKTNPLRGEGKIDAKGEFKFSHKLRNDLSLNEGDETPQVKLYSASSRAAASQVGTTLSVKVNDTSKRSYSLTPSKAAINEGDTLTTSVKTTGIAKDTTLYWEITGSGVDANDFVAAAKTNPLRGEGKVDAKGEFKFSHTLKKDLSLNEGDETLQVKLYSASSRAASSQVGTTLSMKVNDTSKRTYSLTPSKASINEGDTLTTTVKTTGVAKDTTLYWEITGSGVDANDFDAKPKTNPLRGEGKVDAKGVFKFSHKLRNDLSLNEGNEILQVKLYSTSSRAPASQLGKTLSVKVNDTSTTPTRTDLDITRRFVTEAIPYFPSLANAVDVRSDVVYGFILDALIKYANKPTPVNAKNLVGPQTTPGSPKSPMKLASYPNLRNDDCLLQTEYEFSRDTVIRTQYNENFIIQKNGAETRWSSVTRDVITGQFTIKDGQIAGAADRLLRGEYDSRKPIDVRYTLFTKAGDASIGSLAALAPDQPYSQSAFKTAYKITYTQYQGRTIEERQAINPPTSLSKTEILGLDQGRFFTGEWFNEPFSTNLLQ